MRESSNSNTASHSSKSRVNRPSPRWRCVVEQLVDYGLVRPNPRSPDRSTIRVGSRFLHDGCPPKRKSSSPSQPIYYMHAAASGTRHPSYTVGVVSQGGRFLDVARTIRKDAHPSADDGSSPEKNGRVGPAQERARPQGHKHGHRQRPIRPSPSPNPPKKFASTTTTPWERSTTAC